MFGEYIQESNIIELVEEGVDAESSTYRATLRVLEGMSKRWMPMMRDMLREASEEPSFDLEPHKSFYWDPEAEALRYCWVLLVWGDLEIAAAGISDILARKYTPPRVSRKAPVRQPPPAKKAQPDKPAKKSRLESRTYVTDDGFEITRTRVPLPHHARKQGRYDGDPHEIVGLDTPKGKFKATARTRGRAAFAPKKMNEGEL